jgi:hypothetical protein
MLLRLCQLKSLLKIKLCLFLLISCSIKSVEKDSREVFGTYSNQWFGTNINHALLNINGEPISHLFFDLNSEYDAYNKEVNVIIVTPEGSNHGFDIDLSSGQRYYTHSYCKQNDIWKFYHGPIYRPLYSTAYLPKVLDQLGTPQKVIVWSRTKNISQTFRTHFQKVRLVGAYVEQTCPVGNCIGKNNWLSRLVFIGIDSKDESLKDILSVSDFKKFVNWEQSKAFLENIDGLNSIGEKYYPSKRIGELLDFDDAFNYFKKRSIIIKNKELSKIQKGCHKLYDTFLEDVSKQRLEDLPAKDVNQMKLKNKLRLDLKKKKLPFRFAKRLSKFTKSYFNEISTCEKLIYHGNINKNSEDFWFLSYMGIFFKLHREGYFFDCKNQSWRRNEYDSNGELIYDLDKDIDKCDESDFDLAINYLPNFLEELKSGGEYYKFIDYDNHSYGTHSKIFSWVKIKTPRFDCVKDSNEEILRKMKLSPDDAPWKIRKVQDINDQLKIIE